VVFPESLVPSLSDVNNMDAALSETDEEDSDETPDMTPDIESRDVITVFPDQSRCESCSLMMTCSASTALLSCSETNQTKLDHKRGSKRRICPITADGENFDIIFMDGRTSNFWGLKR
jgi:hypothetical protein